MPADFYSDDIDSIIPPPTPEAWPSLELLYTHLDMSIYNQSNILSSHNFLEFNVTGLRHPAPSHDKVEFDLSNGHRTLGPAYTVRIVYSNDDKILAIGLGQVDNTTYGVGSTMSSQRTPKEDSILGPDWGGLLYKPVDYVTFTEFDPGEWNDCGQKDHYWRQFCCKLEDWATLPQYFGRNDGALITFVIGIILLSLASVVLLCGLLWMVWRWIRNIQGQRRKEKEQNEEETDKLLLEGTENPEEAKLGGEFASIDQSAFNDK